MGQTVANGGILLKNGKKWRFLTSGCRHNSKMTAFSDFENAFNVFLATFSVVYGMKLEQKVALEGSNCRKWWYFAEKLSKMFVFYVRMTSYSKMTTFSDFENHSKVFFTTFSWGICIKFRSNMPFSGSK